MRHFFIISALILCVSGAFSFPLFSVYAQSGAPDAKVSFGSIESFRLFGAFVRDEIAGTFRDIGYLVTQRSRLGSHLAAVSEAAPVSFWCKLKGLIGLDCIDTAAIAPETPEKKPAPPPRKAAEVQVSEPVILTQTPEVAMPAPVVARNPEPATVPNRVLSVSSIVESLKTVFAPLSSLETLKERIGLLEERGNTPANTLDEEARRGILALQTQVNGLRSAPSYPPAPFIGGDGKAVVFNAAAPNGTFAGDVSASTATISGGITGGGFTTASGALSVGGASTLSGALAAGGTLYVDAVNGRVGIGSSTPTDTLSLNGPLFLASTTLSNTASRLYNTGSNLYWAGSLIGGATTGNWTTDGTHAWRASGNVGIGTSSPYAKLSVAGEIVGAHFTATSSVASSFPYASTTALTVSGIAYFSSLNGPLQANNGVVSATTSITHLYGGTGLTATPSFGQILRGTGTGYALVATSTLGIALSDTSGTLPVSRGGTGQTSFGQGWLHSDGTTLTSSTSPTVNYITATSTTATSTFSGGLSVAGSAGLTVLQNGKVGIGTAAPGYNLTVRNDSGTATTTLSIENRAGSGIAQIAFGASVNDPEVRGAYILSKNDGTSAANLIFGTGNGAPPSERMRIDTAGRVGIGTTSPAAELEVGNSTDGGIASIVTNSNGGTAANAQMQVRNGYAVEDAMRMFAIGTGYTTNGAFVQDSGVLVAGGNLSGGLSVVARGASAPMRFYTGGFADSNERIRIDSAGNVGIGTSTPYAKLSVWGQGTTTATAFEIANNASTTIARFLDNGNISIGTGTTTFPSARLQVNGTTPSGGILVYDSSTANSSPVVEVRGRRSDSNTSQTFSGGLALSKLRTDAATAINSNVGTVYFGANHTDGTEANLLYSASISGIAEGTFSGASAMPTGLAFYTGSTGTALGTANVAYGTEALRINSSGNVGIGTTSPYAKLSVTNTGSAPSFVVEDSASPDASPFIIDASGKVGIGTAAPGYNLTVRNDSGTATTTLSIENRAGSGIAQIAFGASVNDPEVRGAYILSKNDGTTAANLIFGTGNGAPPSERMRIDTEGKVGISSSTPWRTLSVNGTVAFSGLTSSATGNAVCITTGKDITDAGAASCVPSSVRFKENVEILSEGFALDELQKLSVVSFDYKDGAYSPEDLKGSYGMIAEDVEKIDPKLVDYGYDGKPLTLKFEKFIGLFVQAIQELVARVTGLEDKFNSQQAEIDALKARVNAIDGQTAPPPPPPVPSPESESVVESEPTPAPVTEPEPLPEPLPAVVETTSEPTPAPEPLVVDSEPIPELAPTL